MDAKAKVVAWQWQGSDGQWRECTFHGQDEYIRYGFPVRELVTLTDHEAALAELRAERDEALVQRDLWHGRAVNLTKRNTTLLTGLEALAGRLRRRELTVPDPSNSLLSMLDAIASEVDTLTNSAKADNDGR